MPHVPSPPGGCQHGGTGCPGQAALRRGAERRDEAGGIARKPRRSLWGCQRGAGSGLGRRLVALSSLPSSFQQKRRGARGDLITVIKCTAASLGRMEFSLERRRLKPRPGRREDRAGAVHGAATSLGPGRANVTPPWCPSRIPVSPGSWHRGVAPWHGHREAATEGTGTNGAQETTVAVPPPCSGTLLCLIWGFPSLQASKTWGWGAPRDAGCLVGQGPATSPCGTGPGRGPGRRGPWGCARLAGLTHLRALGGAARGR